MVKQALGGHEYRSRVLRHVAARLSTGDLSVHSLGVFPRRGPEREAVLKWATEFLADRTHMDIFQLALN
eukprot:1900139-Pyramimonas_sp.AAC.1